MDPNFGFNSPSIGPVKPATGLSRPPRLAKLRKPLSGHKPVPKSVQQNAGLDFVFGSNDHKVFDEMQKLKIESENVSLNSLGMNSNVLGSGKDQGLVCVDESVVSVKNEVFSNGFVGNETNKLNVVNESLSKSSDTLVIDGGKDLKIEENVGGDVNDNKFLFGKIGSGFSFQGGSNVGYGNEITSMLPQFTSSSFLNRPAGGFTEGSFVDNASKKVEFSFTSKLDTMGAQNVEFKTLDPKGHVAFGLKKMESSKDTVLKKKKGKSKLKKPGYIPLGLGKEFVFQESLHKYSDSSDQYSPMEVSPYEEILVDKVFSRGTSVASEDSFQVSDTMSSTEEQQNISNDIADEQLVSETESLHINESGVKGKSGQDEESTFRVNEEVAVSAAETESFKSAMEELDNSGESFTNAADDEVTSRLSSGRQDKDGQTQFNTDANLPDVGKPSFVFSASYADPSESLVSSLSSQKKKNRVPVTQDLYSSTPNVKNAQASSVLPPYQVSGSSLLSPDEGQKSNLLRHKGDNKPEQVVKLEVKQDFTADASVAAHESCEKWRLRGNQAYAKGDFLNAEDCYTRGLNSISKNEASKSCLRAQLLCYSNRAATRMSLGRIREALQDCMKAAALDPNFLRVQIRAGSCYLTLGDFENASLHFMKCLQAGPGACADRKLLVEASEGLEKIRKVADCIKQASVLLGRKTSHDIDSAVSLIAEALSISSYSDKLLQLRVDTLLMLKKYEDLILFCEQLLPMESNFVASGADHSLDFPSSDLKSAPSFRIWCCTLILKSYFYLGKLEQALVFVKKQEELVSVTERSECNNLESMIPLVGTIRELLRHKTAGNEAYQSGKHAEAVEHYSASISCSVESRPFAAICFCNRAAAYRSMGHIVEALSDCSLAIALDGNYFKAIARRAALYEMIRDYGQAVRDLQKLVSLLTSHPGPSDKLSCVNELKKARLKLPEMEEAARRETPLDMYLILGIDQSAAASDIRKAYRKAALKYHPDKAGQSLAKNESQDGIWKEIAEDVRKDADRLFKMIGEAYAVLSDPTKRSRYDLEEELRNAPKRSHEVSTSKMHSNIFQTYQFGRGGSPFERDGSPFGRGSSFWESYQEARRSSNKYRYF